MKTSDFYYDLPQERIAQDPLLDRTSSRLMHVDRYNKNPVISYYRTSTPV